MGIYIYNNSDDAYAEALRRIEESGESTTELDLSGLGLTDIPSEITHLTNLLALYLNNNRLTIIPPTITQLTNLTIFKLANNQLTTIPSEFAQLTNLTVLVLSDNWLTSLPFEITRLTELRKLWFSNNKLTSIHSEITQLINLTTLYLSGNELTDIPSEIAQLTNLTILNLAGNQLTTITPQIAQLTNLTGLWLHENHLTVIPPEIAQLTSLITLNLESNRLTSIPSTLAQLAQLTVLSLCHNKLEKIPPVIKLLVNLRHLDIDDNQLTAVPEWLVHLPQLEKLTITGNPITEPPPELLEKALTAAWHTEDAKVDLEAIRRYYAQLERAGKATFYEAKLLLIGEGGAGKTSLARKLLNPTAPLRAKEESTEGIDILKYHFPIPADLRGFENLVGLRERHYTANIWDFGGQSVYHATHQFFLSKRSVYILLTDTRRQHTDFYDWLQMQEAFGQDSPIILLKNGNRTNGNAVIIENEHHLRQRFPNLKQIDDINLANVPDDKQWVTLLTHIQEYLLALDHIGKPCPKTWVNIRQALDDDPRDTISRRHFLTLCATHGITDPADALQLSDYLHHVGDILHFESDPVLRDLVILNPTWALDAVYRVLDNKQIIADNGQFSRQQLNTLWHEEKYDNHRVHLLRLMENFKLCYPLGDDTYIAPQLLPAQAPTYNWNSDRNNLQLRYRYPIFMPRGILSRAIVALHKRIESQDLVWRTGVILRDKYARAELLELRGEKEIRIRVSGRNKRDLLMEIIRALDDLHNGFSDKLQYDKLVPCNCETCAPSPAPHFFPLGKLLERLSHRKESIECNNSPYADVQIRTLIDDAIAQTLDGRGTHIHVGGDYINVGDMNNVTGASIGHKANASTHTP